MVIKNLKKRALLLVFLFLGILPLNAARLAPERAYQRAYASNLADAKTEVIAPDGTRCDILTPTHAIEVDFADKWAESIGQALNYAIQFKRRARIVLILESPRDRKYSARLRSVIEQYALPIDIYEVDAASSVLPQFASK